MHMFSQHIFRGAIITAWTALAVTASADGGRKTVSLDGTWQIAEGSMAETPKAFSHEAPVPGLADMAVPAFEGVGAEGKDPRREAFWYRRTFRIEGPVPAVAMLKIHKACYGTRVYLNGQVVGDHAACFTPGYFDVRKQLEGQRRGQRVGHPRRRSRTAVPESVPWGHDFEKIRYIPGIYDSVELILSGSPAGRPRASGARRAGQEGPRVGRGARGEARRPKPGPLHRPRGRHATSRRHRRERSAASWKPGQQQTVDLATPIAELPPLVARGPVPVRGGNRPRPGDTLTARFGMRSFSFDAADEAGRCSTAGPITSAARTSASTASSRTR